MIKDYWGNAEATPSEIIAPSSYDRDERERRGYPTHAAPDHLCITFKGHSSKGHIHDRYDREDTPEEIEARRVKEAAKKAREEAREKAREEAAKKAKEGYAIRAKEREHESVKNKIKRNARHWSKRNLGDWK